MKLFLAAIVVLVPLVYSAPASQYFIYPSAPFAPITYKLPGTIVQTTTPLKLSDNGKQILYYYPQPAASTLTYPYQIITLRDDAAAPGNNFDFWQVIQNWFGQAGGQGESGASGESGAAPEASAESMKFLERFDLLDKDGKKMPEAMKKEEMRKYFILTQPQLFGSYATLSPYSPIYTSYQPLTAISGRSLEPVAVQQPLVPVEQPVLAVEPQVAQVVPEAVPLVKAVEPIIEPIVVVDPLLAASNVAQEKVVLAEVPLQARSALEPAEKEIKEIIPEKEIEKKAEEEPKLEEMKEEIKIEQKTLEGNF